MFFPPIVLSARAATGNTNVPLNIGTYTLSGQSLSVSQGVITEFGANTVAGEAGVAVSGTSISSGDASGHWQIVSGKITPSATGDTANLNAGPYSLTLNDGQTVNISIVANARTVATDTELENILDGTTVPASGETVLLRNKGTQYDVHLMTTTGQPSNITYKSADTNDRATVGRSWGFGSGTHSNITFQHLNLTGDNTQWESQTRMIGQGPINGSSAEFFKCQSVTSLTGLTVEDCTYTTGIVPWRDGGMWLATDPLIFGKPSGITDLTFTRVLFYRCGAGLRLDGIDTFVIEECTFQEVHVDAIGLNQGCANGIIRNNHHMDIAGNNSNFHSDFIQFNTSGSGGFSNIEIYGNTGAFGSTPIPAEIQPGSTPAATTESASFTCTIASHHGRRINLTPSAAMAITLPSAASNKGAHFLFRKNNNDSNPITFTLNGADTIATNPYGHDLSDNGDCYGLWSNGTSEWQIFPIDERDFVHMIDSDTTLGSLQEEYAIFVDASGGDVTLTLPAEAGQYFAISRKDNSANTVTVQRAGTDTIDINHGSSTSTGQTSFTIAQGYGVQLTGDTLGTWDALEKGYPYQNVFGNAVSGTYTNIDVHGNIFYTASTNSFSLEEGSSSINYYNNTLMVPLLEDANSDGVIGAYEMNDGGTYARIRCFDQHKTQNNYLAGGISIPSGTPINLGDIEAEITSFGGAGIPSSYSTHFAPTTRADYRPTTRQQVIDSVLAKSAGPLDGTFIGAVGTTEANGYYNFTSGAVNTGSLPNPTVSSTSPADNATDVAVTTAITVTFDQMITNGTGNILLREGGVTVETFNAATLSGDNTGTLSISGNVLTITPGANLSNSATVSVQIAATAIDSLFYGTSYAGIADDTTLNFTTIAGGVSENAVDFASGAVVNMNSNGLPTTGTGFTIALKVQPQSLAANEYIVGKGTDSYIRFTASGAIQTRIEDTTNTALVSLDTTTTTWTTSDVLSIVFSANQSGYELMVNGTLEDSGTYTTANTIDIPQYVNGRNTAGSEAANNHWSGIWAADAFMDASTWYSSFFDGSGNWQSGPFGGGSVNSIAPDFVETGNATAWNANSGVTGTITDV